MDNIKIQNGFDLESLPTELKITTSVDHGNGKISLTNANGFEIDAKVTNDGKLLVGATVTITDANGKTMSFTNGAEIAANTETKVADINSKDVDIKGKEISLQVGANTADSQTLKVKIENVSTKSLGLDSKTIATMAKEGTKGTEAANKMIDSLDKALERVNTSRANLGAMQNRLETTASNLTTSNENLTAAESRIRDVDVAEEMMNLSKLNLINQAAQAMMSQAKSQPEGVMQLLR